MSLDGEKKWIKELEKGSYIDRDKKVWDKEKCNRMLTYLTSKLERDYEIGEFIHETEHYCFDLILTSENTISLIDFGEYDDLRKASGIDWRWCLKSMYQLENCYSQIFSNKTTFMNFQKM